MQKDGRIFESKTRQTLVVETGIDSSTAKRSATGASITIGVHAKEPFLLNGHKSRV